MQVGRHRVPDAACVKHGQAEQELAGFHRGRNDELVDRALIAFRERAALKRDGLVDGDLGHFVAGVGGGRDEVILGGVGRIVGGKDDILGAHGHIETVARNERMGFTVDCN